MPRPPAPPLRYTLSLHDALPISIAADFQPSRPAPDGNRLNDHLSVGIDDRESAGIFIGDIQTRDRKSTRLNSSHVATSYAVFCLRQNRHRTPRAYRCRCERGGTV